jgi:hypothetical protein
LVSEVIVVENDELLSDFYHDNPPAEITKNDNKNDKKHPKNQQAREALKALSN